MSCIAAREEDLLRGVVGVEFAIAVEREGECAAQHVEHDYGFGPAAGAFEEHAVDLALVLKAESAAVGEGALAERLEVAGVVEHLGGEEQLDLVESVGELLLPAADDIDFGAGVLGQLRAELAHCRLDIVGEGLDGVPGDVGGGRPAALDRLFVEVGGVVCPELALLADLEAEGSDAGNGECASRLAGLVVPEVGDVAVDADVEGVNGEAVTWWAWRECPTGGCSSSRTGLGGAISTSSASSLPASRSVTRAADA